MMTSDVGLDFTAAFFVAETQLPVLLFGYLGRERERYSAIRFRHQYNHVIHCISPGLTPNFASRYVQI